MTGRDHGVVRGVPLLDKTAGHRRRLPPPGPLAARAVRSGRAREKESEFTSSSAAAVPWSKELSRMPAKNATPPSQSGKDFTH
jgi:hypothetical protein